MRTYRAITATLVCGVLALASLSGCVPGKAKIDPTKTSADDKKANIPGAVNTVGVTIHWQRKLNNGVTQPVMELQAESGTANVESQSGAVNNAHGLLYKDGVARAEFQAPHVEASSDQDTVTASNGVVIRSKEPKGITVTADRVTWRFSLDRIVAEGHVRFVYLPVGATKPEASGGAEHVTIDTALQKLTIP